MNGTTCYQNGCRVKPGMATKLAAIPAHAVIQSDAASLWIPAFAGMVTGGITVDYFCIILR